MTSAIIGHGTALKLEDSPGAGTYTTIAEVQSINGLNLSLDSIDVTNMDSSNQWREFIAGLRDAGEISFDINWFMTGATHGVSAGLLQDFNSSSTTTRLWQIIWPDTGSTTWSFSGFVTGFSVSDPFDGAVTASITIKLTGAPTLA
jgi:predicted secreted protein